MCFVAYKHRQEESKQHQPRMEIVSSDDDDDDSFFDTVVIVCQDAFSDSSSDDEDHEEEKASSFVWGGSTQGRASNIERHRVFYSHLLFKDHVRHKKFSVTGAKNHSRSSVAPVQEKHQYTPKIGFYKRYLVSVDKKNSVTGGDALSD